MLHPECGHGQHLMYEPAILRTAHFVLAHCGPHGQPGGYVSNIENRSAPRLTSATRSVDASRTQGFTTRHY